MLQTVKRAALIVGLAVAACSAPPYDEQIDRLISALQSDVDGQIVTLISLDHKIAEFSTATIDASRRALGDARGKASYDANAAFYDKIDSQITSLRLRIDALPNEATPNLDRSLDELRANLLSDQGSLRSVHQQQGILGEAYLLNERKLLNAQFQALLTYELVLKTGAPAGKK
jgi:hypothetical protein